MTHDEQVAMYMKLTKRELAEMLANANAAVEAGGPQASYHLRAGGAAAQPSLGDYD